MYHINITLYVYIYIQHMQQFELRFKITIVTIKNVCFSLYLSSEIKTNLKQTPSPERAVRPGMVAVIFWNTLMFRLNKG